MFQTRKNAFAVVGSWLYVWLRLHSLESGALVSSQILGNEHHYVYKFVAAAAVFIVGQTFSAKAKNFAGLSSGGNVDSCASCYSRNFHRAAESGRGNVEHKIVDYVGSVADKFGMLNLFNNHK